MQVECPRCNQRAQFPDSLAGSEARCPSCGGLIPLPVAAAEDAANEPQPVGHLPEGSEEEKPAPAASEGGSVFARLDGAGVTDSEVLDPSRLPPEPPRKAPLWVKLTVVVLPLLVVLAVVGTVLGLHLERKAYARKTAASFDAAKKSYEAAELEEADRVLGESLQMLEARPDAVPEEWAASLRKEADRLRSHIGLWREARKAAAGMGIEPAATRRRLEDLLKQVQLLGPEAQPVARLIGRMREKAFEQDLSDRRKGLEKHLAGILAQVDEAKFDSARDAVKLARETIAKAPVDMRARLTEAFEARFKELDAVFSFYAETDKLVKAAPDGGPKRLAEAKRIAALKSSPAAAGVGAKGIALQFEKWAKELAADRRALPKALSINDLMLTDIAREFAAAAPGLRLDEKSIDGHRSLFKLSSAKHNYRVQACELGGRAYFMIEVDGVRLAYPVPDNRARKAIIRYEMTQAPIVAEDLRKSGHEMAWSATPWHVFLSGPQQGSGPTAVLRGKGLVCTAGRVWKVSGRPTEDALRRAGSEFVRAAKDLEEAVRKDRAASKELREMLAMMVKAAYQPRESATDFLPRQFCSEAVARGYIEKNAPDLGRRLEARLAAYRGAYRRLVHFVPGLAGKSGDDEIEWGLNADGRALWRIYDAKADTTTFALRHNDAQFRNQFYVHTVFAGKHPSWPLTAPKEVRMVHHAVGQTASWNPETDKLTVDRDRWRLATAIEQIRKAPAFFGSPDWRLPPHVLITDSMGSALGLVTPQGRLDMPEFGRRSGAERRKVQDEFLNKCAHRLRSPGELHLFFRYFLKYTYDSPLTDYPFLIGDKQNTGDVHQDAYQTLDRKIGGRFIADCDDLAELYQAITRRQGRLSFVLGQPSHAICGFVERDKEKGDYIFTTVDTGPPRQFRAAKLDAVVEAAFATFDEEHTEAFDPNSICFLLRFAGEQTRTPYFLGTRMFVDPKYAKTMIRVQRDWHFAYICSGRDTMVEMVKREKDAPTLFELAAFYRETGQWPLAIEWCKKGIAALPADDVMGRLTESVRLATYLERSGDKEAARKVVLKAAAEVTKAEAAPGANPERFVGLRFSLASDLKTLDRPFEAWATAVPAVRLLARKRRLAGDNLTRLAVILQGMRDLERSGKKLDEKQKAAAQELETTLINCFASGHFKEEDTSRTHMDRYADLAIFYAARDGREKALSKLLAPGPYPEGKRAHHKRGTDLEALADEDWRWLRVSVHAYSYFFNEALDRSKPPEKRRPADAVRVLAALERALPEIRKQGALGGLEFSILAMRVRRDAITKNWAGIERTFQLMKKRNWGRLYRLVSLSLGETSAYMTAAEFETQFRKFCEQEPPLPHYLRVAYEALRNKRYRAALIAARVTAERFQKNQEVQKEYRLLRELIGQRAPDALKEPAPEAPKPAPEKEPRPEETPAPVGAAG